MIWREDIPYADPDVFGEDGKMPEEWQDPDVFQKYLEDECGDEVWNDYAYRCIETE